jgi:hypothetical protein
MDYGGWVERGEVCKNSSVISRLHVMRYYGMYVCTAAVVNARHALDQRLSLAGVQGRRWYASLRCMMTGYQIPFS